MSLQEVLVPDIGNFDSVDVIEIMVKVGDTIAKDDSLLTVESDKASMDIPAPFGGVVKEIMLKMGDKIAQGHLILSLEAATAPLEAKLDAPASGAPLMTPENPVEAVKAEAPKVVAQAIPEPSRPVAPPPAQIKPVHQPLPVGESAIVNGNNHSHASPSARKFARELGVNLALVKGTAPKNRITEADIQLFVKNELAKPRSENMGAGLGALATLPMPVIDFSQFGEVENKALSRIKKLSGANKQDYGGF